jgi:hypothetical protein
MAVQTAALGYKDVPYGAELFVKNRWAGIAAVDGGMSSSSLTLLCIFHLSPSFRPFTPYLSASSRLSSPQTDLLPLSV